VKTVWKKISTGLLTFLSNFVLEVLSLIQHGFAPSFVNYKKGCTRLAAASDKVYQLLAHGRWFSPASSTTKTGCHDIAEILLKVELKHQPEALKSLYRSPGNKKKQLVLCKNYVLQW
jgi:hypothetical protein